MKLSKDHDPKREFAINVVRRLVDAGYIALWAGGCVRDLLIGQSPEDFDVATNAKPEEVRKVFGQKQTVPVGVSFGVIMVVGSKQTGNIEVATFRAEGEYSDGRRPNKVTFCTPEEDAHRRDFTINGMFYDPLQEEVLDYVGGHEDLVAGRIRAIGNPDDRMQEDKLRMLRAVRFTARFDFDLDESTANAVRQMAAEILVVSWERIAEEFRKMLKHPNRAKAVQLTGRLGLLDHIFPEFDSSFIEFNGIAIRKLLDELKTKTFEPAISLLALLIGECDSDAETRPSKDNAPEDVMREVCRRLKLSNDESDHICWLVEKRDALKHPADIPLSRLKRLLAHKHARDLIEIMRASDVAIGRPPKDADFLLNYLAETPMNVINPPPLINGEDLKNLGIQPGPAFKQILDAVRDAQLDEEIDSKEEAMELAGQLIKT